MSNVVCWEKKCTEAWPDLTSISSQQTVIKHVPWVSQTVLAVSFSAHQGHWCSETVVAMKDATNTVDAWAPKIRSLSRIWSVLIDLRSLMSHHRFYHHSFSSRQVHCTESVRPSIHAHLLFTRLSEGAVKKKVDWEGERKGEKQGDGGKKWGEGS